MLISQGTQKFPLGAMIRVARINFKITGSSANYYNFDENRTWNIRTGALGSMKSRFETFHLNGVEFGAEGREEERKKKRTANANVSKEIRRFDYGGPRAWGVGHNSSPAVNTDSGYVFRIVLPPW